MQTKLKKRYTNALLGVSIFVACFTIFVIAINQEQPRIVFVTGVSMYPTYLPFDMLIIEDVDPREIDIGDVIIIDNSTSYLPYEYYIAHRVTHIKDLPHRISFVTQGDNNPQIDGYSDSDKVLGRVFQHIPFVGFVLAPPFSYGVIAGTALLFLFNSKTFSSKKIK